MVSDCWVPVVHIVTTRYVPVTDFFGSRISAWTWQVDMYGHLNGKKDRVIVPFGSEDHSYDAHLHAALALLRRHAICDWELWAHADTPGGYQFVFKKAEVKA